jgi:hypothetical protein
MPPSRICITPTVANGRTCTLTVRRELFGANIDRQVVLQCNTLLHESIIDTARIAVLLQLTAAAHIASLYDAVPSYSCCQLRHQHNAAFWRAALCC